MKRDIEFRGMPIEDYGTINWFYGGIYLNHDDKLAYIVTDHNGTVPVKWDTVGQYIGKKDDYEQKIFEGDYLDFANGNFGTVYFDECQFQVSDYFDKFQDVPTDAFEEFELKDVKVIGNVHQHSHLYVK